jgi:hypothetical protein
MGEVSAAWSLGVIQGLLQSAALVEQLTDHYSNPAARAALGLTRDSLLEKVAELTAGNLKAPEMERPS